MLAALALVLGCAACTDRHPVLAEPEPEMELLGTLQCTADVRTLHMTCTEVTPSTPGISPALFGTNQVELASSNVAHDAETGIFRMDVTAQNLLTYAIGTPDGTTRAGFKVFFQSGPNASYHTLGDTGTVRVHNPTGYQNFTAGQQPYFLYDTILQPQEVAAPQRWEFSVPSTVKGFGFTVRVFTATQREDKVPMTAPNHMPAAYENPSRWNRCFGNSPIRCVTNAVRLGFHGWASAEERQSAVDYVKGRVDGGDGTFYYVTVPLNGSVDSLWSTIRNLEKLPQVRQATPVITESGLTVNYSLAHDNPQWRQWKLDPDSADGQNWGLERIAAPYAWGCSVGDTTTAVAVVDMGFHALSDLSRNLDTTRSVGVGTHSDTMDHGTRVAAIMSARGNDSSQVTGTMWRADLRAYDISSVDTAGKPLGVIDFRRTFAHIRAAGRSGARVVNLSFGIAWRDSTNKHFRNPATETDSLQRMADSASMALYAGALEAELDTIATAGGDPLIVIAAGNDGLDARWQGMAGALTGTHGHRIMLVAASTRSNALWTGSNRGAPAQIAAPGAGLHVLWGNGSIDSTRTLPSGSRRSGTGTSFAAPHVAGAAGLLFSFDPRLTAAQVKQLLLDGAVRGNRSAGGIPILNIRESLILAGRRAGAPLCGNRLWIDETGMYAQRDTSTATGELLFPVTRSSSRYYYFDALHGGKQIQVRAGSLVLATWSPTGWTTATTAWDWEHPMANGTWNSGNGYSHSGDTVFSLRREVHENATVFWPRLETGGVVKQLANPITRARRNGPPVCVSVLDSIRASVLQPIRNDSRLSVPYHQWRAEVDANGGCTTNGPAAEVLESDAWYAYHPEGREAYVFVSEQVGVAALGAWTSCTTKHALNYVDASGIPQAYYFRVDGRCRNVESLLESAAPAIFHVRLSTEAVTPYAFTGTAVARGEISSPALGEDGREVRWQLRDRTSRVQRNWIRGPDGVSTLSGGLDAGLTVTCTTQFRNFRTGQTTLTPPITCDGDGGIAANRLAAQN